MTSATKLPAAFGRYRILKQLGRGGMGEVFLAHDSQFERRVALKVAHSSGAGSEGLERFLREARLAAMLAHPNLCRVYDSGDIGGRHYLTMAYIEGRSLAEVLRRDGPLPPRQAAALVRTIALALHTAHRQGIIHRDLKPANLMIDPRGEPIVMDFGLARGDQDVRATLAGQTLGTPAYMPPEQVMGDLESMGPCCDIYSLGVILFETLTGQPPFRGDLASTMRQVLAKVPDRPSQVRPGIDPALEAICLKAMAKKPAERHPSMEAFATALTAYLEGKAESTLEALPASPTPARRWCLPGWIPIGGAGLVAAGLLAAVLWVQSDQGTLRIEADPELTVLVDGKEVVMGKGAEPVRLRVGKHQLVVMRGSREVERREITVRKGRNKVLKVP